MATWDNMKGSFTQQKASLDSSYSDTSIESKVTEMNTAISRYIRRAGIQPAGTASSEDPDYKQATETFQWLTDGQKRYMRLLKDMSQAVSGVTSDADIQQKLKQVGQIKDSIVRLEKAVKDAKQDLETSKSRQDTVEKPRQEVSLYQGFSRYIGFTKPIKQTSVPFLIGFGLLLLFFSGLITKEFFGLGAVEAAESFGEAGMKESILATLRDSRFYSALAGVTFVSVVVGALAYNGYFGKAL